MAKVNLVNKQVQMQLDQIIRLQIITHCYINHITLSELDLDCLVSLSKIKEIELTDFCTSMSDERLVEKLKTWVPRIPNEKPPTASSQTIRNSLIKCKKEQLIVKSGKGRKKISLNPELKVQTTGNIMLNYKFIRLDSQKSI